MCKTFLPALDAPLHKSTAVDALSIILLPSERCRQDCMGCVSVLDAHAASKDSCKPVPTTIKSKSAGDISCGIVQVQELWTKVSASPCRCHSTIKQQSLLQVNFLLTNTSRLQAPVLSKCMRPVLLQVEDVSIIVQHNAGMICRAFSC